MTTAVTINSSLLERSAKQRNANAIRHGMRGSSLPPGCSYIAIAIQHFRRQLEKAVLEARDEITILDAATINTAFRYERLAQLAQRWLAVNHSELTYSEKLAMARESARASAERDKAIAALRLDEKIDPRNLWNGTLPALGRCGTLAESSAEHSAIDPSDAAAVAVGVPVADPKPATASAIEPNQ